MPKRTDIASILILAASAALWGCGSTVSEAPDQRSLAQLTEIEATCELPSGALTGKAPVSGELMPTKIACAAEEARKRNLTIGFISNPVDPNAPSD